MPGRESEKFMWNAVERMKFLNMTDQVLHVPGNFRGGQLEMAVVMDAAMEPDRLKDIAGGLAGALKSHGETFRNVRLNTVLWKGNSCFKQKTAALAELKLPRFYEEMEQVPGQKALDELIWQLKFYYARSKLIYVITGGEVTALCRPYIQENLRPFLAKKLIWIAGDRTAADLLAGLGQQRVLVFQDEEC